MVCPPIWGSPGELPLRVPIAFRSRLTHLDSCQQRRVFLLRNAPATIDVDREQHEAADNEERDDAQYGRTAATGRLPNVLGQPHVLDNPCASSLQCSSHAETSLIYCQRCLPRPDGMMTRNADT